jgi:hypothetical protein
VYEPGYSLAVEGSKDSQAFAKKKPDMGKGPRK